MAEIPGKYPQRKSLRYKHANYASGGAWAITIRTHQGKEFLGRIEGSLCRLSEIGVIVSEAWQAMPTFYPGVLVDVHAVMPDHFHGIVVINPPRFTHPHLPDAKILSLSKVMQLFKSFTAHHYRALLGAQDAVSLWQRGFWDNFIESEGELDEVRRYILNNPTAWYYEQQRRAGVAPAPTR